ncbi:hypothetical protein ACTFIY_001708 [Dictyostelium cf. discoideum]
MEGISKDEIIKQQQLLIEKLQNRKRELKKKVAELEKKIESLQTNIEQPNTTIKDQNKKIEAQDDRIKAQDDRIKAQDDRLKAQDDRIKAQDDELYDRINAIQDAALIGEQIYLITVCQYYLEHYVLKEINDDKEDKDKISWEHFRCNYIKNKEAIKIAKVVELDKVLELCGDRYPFIDVNDEDEIKKIINNIKILYRALPTPDARYKTYKKSLLRICRYITDEEFDLGYKK